MDAPEEHHQVRRTVPAHDDHTKTITTQGNGLYNFTSLQNFLQAKPMSLTINLPNGATVLGMKVAQDPIYDLRQNNFGLYFQDNYTFSPSLTMNIGLRYEFSTNPTEERGHLNSLRSFYNNQVTYGPLYLNPTLKNFSPRLNFAWFGNHKFSVRAGGESHGRPCSVRSSTFRRCSRTASQDRSRTTLRRTHPLPDAYTQPETLAVAAGALHEYNMKSAKIYRWSLTLEREFGAWWLRPAIPDRAHKTSCFNLKQTPQSGTASRIQFRRSKNFRVANGNVNPSFDALPSKQRW